MSHVFGGWEPALTMIAVTIATTLVAAPVLTLYITSVLIMPSVFSKPVLCRRRSSTMEVAIALSETA